MRVCPRCGTESPDEFKFCPACANPLSAEGPEDAAPREMRKTVTVMFCDLTGSTEIGERIDPETLRRMMERYYERMRGVLERHGGSVEKMIGDAVMGVFGIPLLHEDDALRAVRAAMQMRDALAELNDELDERWGVRLLTRTGVNTGQTIASTMDSFVTGGVAGDAVNVAARLEQAAPPGEIVIGEDTYALVRDSVKAEALGSLDLKGKSEGVAGYLLKEVSATRVARRSESPMVGREEQVAELEAALAEVMRDGAVRLVTVVGAAGVGKSRLVEEFVATVREEATVVTGRCLSYGEGITYWALGEIVRTVARITEQDTQAQARAKIQGLLEDPQAELIAARVASLIGLGGAMGGPDEAHWAVRRLLESLATERPLVVVFEDIYWAEPGLLDLIASLGRQVEAPVLLIGHARPVLLEEHPDWGKDVPGARTVTLEPLADEHARRLIAHLLGDSELPGEVLSTLTAAAEGNPLFVEETISMLIDRGVLSQGEEGWAITGDPSEVSVPPTISAVLAARLERLTADERMVLEVASIGGRMFYAQAAAALAPEPLRPRVAELLAALVDKQLVRPWPSDLAGFDAFAFRHILIREVAYESLPKGERAAMHERLADWIEDSLGERTEEYDEIVGYHCERAFRLHEDLGPVDDAERAIARRAADHLAAAGRRALARLDAPAAAGLLERAAGLYHEDAADRLALLPGLARALVDRGAFDRAREVLGELDAQPVDPGVRSYGALARMDLESLVDPEGWSERAQHVAEDAVAVFSDRSDEHGLTEAWEMLTDVHLLRCSGAEASAAALRAIEHARATGDSSGRSYASYSISLYFGPTPAGEARERLEEVLEFWLIGPGPRAATLWSLAGLRAMQGDFDEARALVEESARLDLDLGREMVASQGRAEMLGRIEMMAGDPGAAETALRSGYEYLERLGERNYAAALAGMLGEATWEGGDAVASARWVDVAEETSTEDDVGAEILWRAGRARIFARSGEEGAARRAIGEAIELAEATDYLDLTGGAYFDLAVVERELGDGEAAADAADRARGLYERKGNLVSAAKVARLAAEPG